MKVLLYPFLIILIIGLILSVIIHIISFLGIHSPFGQLSWGLHVGIFIV